MSPSANSPHPPFFKPQIRPNMESNGTRRKPYDRSGGQPAHQDSDDPERHRNSPSQYRGWLDHRARDTTEGSTMYSSFTPVPGIGSHVSQAILPSSAIGRLHERRGGFKAKCRILTCCASILLIFLMTRMPCGLITSPPKRVVR